MPSKRDKRRAGTFLRAHPFFAKLIHRLVKEGTRETGRRVSVQEVTGLLAASIPSTWAELQRQAIAAPQPQEQQS